MGLVDRLLIAGGATRSDQPYRAFRFTSVRAGAILPEPDIRSSSGDDAAGAAGQAGATVGDEWIVLLEAERAPGAGPIDRLDVGRLRDALDGGRHASALCCADRYAVQVRVTGATPIDALEDVVARWHEVVRRLAIPWWTLVRTEVFTPEELEREHEQAIAVAAPSARPEAFEFVSEDHATSEDLLRRALSDPRTGLAGPDVFEHRVQTRLEDRRTRGILAVVLIAVEPARRPPPAWAGGGDDLAIALAARLAAVLRREDILARVGDNEYGVLLPETSTETAALDVSARLLEAVLAPLTIRGQLLTLSASAGVAVSEPMDSATAVLAKATTALATAKMAGGGAVARG